MPHTPSAATSLTLRVEIEHQPGRLGELTTEIAQAGGLIGAIDIVQWTGGRLIREITVDAPDLEHWEPILDAVRRVDGVMLLGYTDRTFRAHEGGKIEIANRIPLQNRDDLSMAYTPGVARVCDAIHASPEKAHRYTIKHNMVAVVTDGTAVLGLGDIGAAAALPVMEGKAMLFKEFGAVDAFPVCLDTKDPDEIVRTVKLLSPAFGGINLEDISSPRCFEIEERLKEDLDIPVFHDDQHGTAIVTLAALLNATRLTGRRIEDLRVVVVGLGAAGVAVTRILLHSGVHRIVGCDRRGALSTERDDYGDLSPIKRWYAEATNHEKLHGTPAEVLEDADLFVGLSGSGVIEAKDLIKMAPEPIVFAMANPTPEVMPEDAAPFVRVMATGRSDYPNQINNVLAFPGIFRGALDVHATAITEGMKIAAAEAIAAIVKPNELSEDYIIPSVFNRDVASAVAEAVSRVAEEQGVVRPLSPAATDAGISIAG